MNWNSIETAPKDKDILVYCPANAEHQASYAVVRWNNNAWEPTCGSYVDRWRHEHPRWTHTQPTLWAEIEGPE